MGNFQTKTLWFWTSDSKINMARSRFVIFSLDGMFEVNKLFSLWLFAFLQAHTWSVSITGE